MSHALNRTSRVNSRALISLAVLGIVTLNGCSTPFSSNSSSATSHYRSLIAQAIIDDSYRGNLAQEPTIANGVQEVTHVDSAESGVAAPPSTAASTGEAGSSAVSATTATTPTTPNASANEPLGSNSAIANAIGLPESRLNMDEPVFNLSLQEAIARACKHSIAIKVEAYNPAIKESLITQAEAAFDPVVFGYFEWQETDEPSLIPGAGENGQNIQHQIGIKQLLPSGATAQVAASQTWRYINPNDPNNGFPNFTTSYTENLNATVTQPLLRGFGVDVNEANIYLAQRDRRISLATFRRQVITSVADVEAAYHNLILARTFVDIQERLLAATEETRKRVWDRREVDADKISISQTIAAVESRRAELVRSRANLRSQSDALKVLLNDPEISIRSNVLINPTDRPTAEFFITSTADAIETALRQRTELQEDRLQVERSDIVVKVTKNKLLPQLDLTVGVQTNGLDNTFDSAFGSTVSSQHMDFNAGVKLEFPLGNRQETAELVQHQHERSQAVDKMIGDAQKVVQDVKNNLRDVLSSYAEIQARERARVSAAEELRAITQKETIVNLTPEFLQLKLDSENRLAQAEQNLIQALVNYNVAIMRFEQSKGTLLEFNRISLGRAPVSRYDDDLGKINFMGQTYLLR